MAGFGFSDLTCAPRQCGDDAHNEVVAPTGVQAPTACVLWPVKKHLTKAQRANLRRRKNRR
eukprot:3930409-Prorocentrum_lima.AAC.1